MSTPEEPSAERISAVMPMPSAANARMPKMTSKISEPIAPGTPTWKASFASTTITTASSAKTSSIELSSATT